MDKKYEKIINELVEIEMDEMCHDDYPEDYDSKLEFYLSNAERDSYIDYIKDRYDRIEDAEEIQEEVIAEIERRYEAIQLAAAALGRKGGKVKSEAKAKAAAENGKLGGRPRKYGNTLGSKDVIEPRGYVLTQTAAGKLVRSEPFKERVYRINGVDCIEMESQSTASGSILYFFALEDIERDQGLYIKPLRQARYLWKSWHKNKPEIPMRGISVGENEEAYELWQEKKEIEKALAFAEGKRLHICKEDIVFTDVVPGEKCNNGGEYGFYTRYSPITGHPGIYRVYTETTCDFDACGTGYEGIRALTTGEYQRLKKAAEEIEAAGSLY